LGARLSWGISACGVEMDGIAPFCDFCLFFLLRMIKRNTIAVTNTPPTTKTEIIINAIFEFIDPPFLNFRKVAYRSLDKSPISAAPGDYNVDIYPFEVFPWGLELLQSFR